MLSQHLLTKRLIAIVLVIAFVAPFGLLTPLPSHKYVNAQVGVVVTGGLGTIQETLSAISLQKLEFKEYILDPIAWFVAKVLIKHMTRSIVNWINSGFDGNPAFVTDLGGFLTDVADQEIGNFIYGSGLSALCDPFELQIRLSLALKYSPVTEKIACRLSDVVNNIDNFLSGAAGSFQEGGWDGWFRVVTSDNPYNRYLEASQALETRISQAQDRATVELSFNKGFFSWKECTPRSSGAASGSARVAQDEGATDCETVTPGVFIENQLETVAGSGIRQLELANEFNEIVDALVVQLITQVLGGSSSGLRGLSRSTSGGSTYLDNLTRNSSAPTQTSLSSGAEAILDITSQLTVENSYKESVGATLALVEASETLLLELRSCNATLADAQIASSITPLKQRLEQNLTNANSNIALLQNYDARLQGSITTAQAESLIAEYQALARQGIFHSVTEAGQATSDKFIAQQSLNTLDTTTRQSIAECQSVATTTNP